MDWANFIPYCLIWAWTFLIGWRLSHIVDHQHRIEAKVNYLAFVHTRILSGKDPEVVLAELKRMGEEAEAEMKFAEIAQRERPPWWKRVVGRVRK